MSQENQLLRQLGELAREPGGGPPGLDERWERLAAGTLSAEEDAELRRLAETSEEARAAYEAFRPLGADFQAGVVRAIREQAARERGRVLPFRLTRRRVAAWTATAAAAAAAVVLFLIPTPAPLPGYVAELSGGTRELRGEVVEPVESPTFAPGDRFQMTLRPDTGLPRAEPLETRVFVVRDGDVREASAQAELDTSGAARIAGSLAPDLPAGDWVLWTVIGRRGELPEPERLRGAPANAPLRERDWVAVPRALQVRPRAP